MCVCVCVCVFVFVFVFVSGSQANKVLISKYISSHQKGGQVSVGGNGSERQLLASLIRALDWGPLDHASRGPN